MTAVAEAPKPAPPFEPTGLLPDWPPDPFPGQDEWARGWAAVFSSERFRGHARDLEDDVIRLGVAGKYPPENLYLTAASKVRNLRSNDKAAPATLMRRVIWRFVVAALVWRLARGAWPAVPADILEKDADGIVMELRAAADGLLVELGLADAAAVR